MKLPSKVSQWLQTIPTIKFLFLLALFLTLNATANRQYLTYQDSRTQSDQQDQLIDFVLTNGKQQLSPLVKANRIEQAADLLEQQLEYQMVQSIALYQANGQLLDKVVKTKTEQSPGEHLIAKVVPLDENEQSHGYLVYEFFNEQHQGFVSHLWFYYIAAALWLLAAVILYLSKPKQLSRVEKETEPKTTSSYKKELQQLLKRSQAQAASDSENLLIIHSNWESHSRKVRKPLLALLNRWTAHNNSYLVSFDENLLILGLDESLEVNTFKQIQTLEVCFRQLGLNPTLLIHKLNIGEAIYQHFFGIVEDGVWLESSQGVTTAIKESIGIKNDIEIDIESFGLIHLSQLKSLKAQDATAIERQARFYLN